MAITRTFTRDELLEDGLDVFDDGGLSTVETVSDVVVGTKRWSTVHELTFRLPDQPAGEAWRVRYRKPATEMQEEYPWQDEPTVTATLVRQVERLVKVWEPAE